MKFVSWLKFAVISFCFHQVQSDIYLHNPRGSNNRYDENSRNRRNANRLFNSENNDRGGYNVGSLYYYSGSKLQIEWTSQHSCGDQNNHCDIVLQYMCNDLVRDGTSSATIPANPVLCKNLDCNEDRRYGMHEDFFHYAHCNLRSRNRGLFTADQRVRDSARSTRQNRNGNRYGYECTEEKDYYPYWGPSPWRDIVVMTNNVSRCQMYQSESQNVKEKFYCQVGTTYLYQNVVNNPSRYIPITEEECKSFQYVENEITKNGSWVRVETHGIDSPDCIASQPSRDNHLGNTLGGQTMSYNWTIPDYPQESCVLRIRYNISTTDYEGDSTNASFNRGRGRRRSNGPDVWSRHGFAQSEGIRRGYQFQNDPRVNIFNSTKLSLRLAINTAQFARTFQDRSHTFSIRARPDSISPSTRILNLNVRGKRGNIVQVYPAVEYDYVPNTALVEKDSYVHFQWTGSNSNPQIDDGRGAAGTDRSNVVLMKGPDYIEGNPEIYNKTYGQFGSSYPAVISDSILGGLSRENLISLAILRKQRGGDMDELNDAGTYFDLGAVKVTASGIFHYMCTRNNNFSNRSQKGKLIVTSSTFTQHYVDQNGGVLTLEKLDNSAATSVSFPPQSLIAPIFIELWELAEEDANHLPSPPNTDFISKVIYLSPKEELTTVENPAKLSLRLTGSVGALYDIEVYRSTANGLGWEKLRVESQESETVHVHTHSGGYFVASRRVSPSSMAGLVIGLIIGSVLLVALGIYCKKNRLALASYKNKV